MCAVSMYMYVCMYVCMQVLPAAPERLHRVCSGSILSRPSMTGRCPVEPEVRLAPQNTKWPLSRNKSLTVSIGFK
jgi:hypothetical protein